MADAPGTTGGPIFHGPVTSPQLAPDQVPSSAPHLEEIIKNAADLVREALDLTSHAVGNAVESASSAAFESAANVGPNIASSPVLAQATQNSFSWSGYFQAIGLLCLLLAILWFAVWMIRKYGKFNFLPRPGSLPKDSLVMEAQMPLGPKKGLMVIRFLDRRLLLGVTEHNITLLTEDTAANAQKNKDFQSFLPVAASSDSDSDSS